MILSCNLYRQILAAQDEVHVANQNTELDLSCCLRGYRTEIITCGGRWGEGKGGNLYYYYVSKMDTFSSLPMTQKGLFGEERGESLIKPSSWARIT